MPIEVLQTEAFAAWVGKLRDRRAADRIAARLLRATEGQMGDVKFFRGIGEMRIAYGPGYRLYFVQRGATVVILLCGGDKASQKRDIERAIEMAKEI